MASRTPKTTPALSAPIYFNRELSWLAFNRRVLEQAQTDRHPLIERVRYLAITGSNLDEFFQIRVAGLMQQRDSGVTEPGPDGLNPSQQPSASARPSMLLSRTNTAAGETNWHRRSQSKGSTLRAPKIFRPASWPGCGPIFASRFIPC